MYENLTTWNAWNVGIVACFPAINTHLCRTAAAKLVFLQVSNFCKDSNCPFQRSTCLDFLPIMQQWNALKWNLEAGMSLALHRICTAFAQHLHSISNAFAQHLHSICTAFAQHLHSICTVFAQHLHRICTAFAQHLHSICTAFAQHLHSICTSALSGSRCLVCAPMWTPSRSLICIQ